MPRYFFHIHDGFSTLDAEGTELSDLRRAQIEAVSFAGKVIADDARRMKFGDNWALEVADEGGVVLFTLAFSISGTSAVMLTNWMKDDPA